MDWANERYVRVYTRDTVDWSLLSWQARSLWLHLMRKFDRAGCIYLGRHGVRGLAVLVGMPFEVVDQAVEELAKDGCVELRGEWLVAKNFIDAQEADQTDAQRAREYRARRRDRAMLDKLPEPRQLSIDAVTGRDDRVTGVGGVRHSDPADPAVPSDPAEPASRSTGSPSAPTGSGGKKGKRKQQLPPDWKPSPKHEVLAIERGVDLADQATRFRDSAVAHARVYADWDAAFANWLRSDYTTPKNGANGHKSDALPAGMVFLGRSADR
jgi:hypothetical protein